MNEKQKKTINVGDVLNINFRLMQLSLQDQTLAISLLEQARVFPASAGMNRKFTADRAKFIFGQPMNPCPKCGGYNIGYSVPIRLDNGLPDPLTPKSLLSVWAKATKSGHTPLEGTCRLMCKECGHKGPSVDVTGRTSEDVGQDKCVAAETKRLWNQQDNAWVTYEPRA